MTTPTIDTTTLNFSAGPAVLPEQVIEQAARDLRDLDNTGIGEIEHSNRGFSFALLF